MPKPVEPTSENEGVLYGSYSHLENDRTVVDQAVMWLLVRPRPSQRLLCHNAPVPCSSSSNGAFAGI